LKQKLALFCRAVILKLGENENWPAGVVFDGRKNIYASQSVFPVAANSYEVEITDDETNRQRNFTVTIKWAADVDINLLLSYVGCGFHQPFPPPYPTLPSLHCTATI
jgi:hypothetical protein